jgi:hypothetical protein
MTDAQDIAERLGQWAAWLDADVGTEEPAGDDCRAAAAFILSQAEELEGLVGELLPYAESTDDKGPPGEGWQSATLVGLIERASKAIAGPK